MNEERVGRRIAIKTLVVGTVGLAYTGAVLAAGRAIIGSADSPIPSAVPARTDFDVAELAEEGLEQRVGSWISVSGWPEFVTRRSIRNPVINLDGSTFKMDLYRLYEGAYGEGPFIYILRTDPDIPGTEITAQGLYVNKKVLVEGTVMTDPLNGSQRLVPAYLLAERKPIAITAVPPRDY